MEKQYDVIIVGAGITGSVIAKELCAQNEGLNILFLEAGPGKSGDWAQYEKYNNTFFNALYKTPNAAYKDSPFAPSPSVMDPTQIKHTDEPDTNGYFVQYGPFPFLSNYNRNTGGTTLHWLGTTLRMCPNDFQLNTLYGKGVDWPVSYDDMKPYYRRAEYEIGVTGEVDEQSILGITFDPDYVYPMHKIPQSYLDTQLASGVEGLSYEDCGESYDLTVVSTPQGRNGMPNPDYVNLETNKPGYTPVGAVGNPEMGQRCEGNANCVAICPVQAKYNALKTLDAAVKNQSNNVTLISQAPVSTIEIDSGTNEVSRIHYKTYEFTDDGERTKIESHTIDVNGAIVVLAANAIENAKILLASNACTGSGQVGKNLMDHLVIMTWGLLPSDIGAYRGPGSTSGMPMMRDGSFRSEHSAFRVEIGNWGWTWPANTPESTLQNALNANFNKQSGQVDSSGQGTEPVLFGKELQEYLKDQTSRQFRIGWEMEQLPSDRNYVTIDENFKDALGNYRPVIHYELNDYEKKGAFASAQISEMMFDKMNIESFTNYDPNAPGYFEYPYKDDLNQDQVYKGVFNGAGHVVGCHRMGIDPTQSVVDSNQKAHDHGNLFVAGAGSFPSLATSNPTLTLTALAFKTADAISQMLNS